MAVSARIARGEGEYGGRNGSDDYGSVHMRDLTGYQQGFLQCHMGSYWIIWRTSATSGVGNFHYVPVAICWDAHGKDDTAGVSQPFNHALVQGRTQ
jgi:hypothetical protein